jgi:hypothetical protein
MARCPVGGGAMRCDHANIILDNSQDLRARVILFRDFHAETLFLIFM